MREVNRIGEELKAMIDGGVRKLVIDFKHVQHCGSAGLGILIALLRKMESLNGKMIVSHPENIAELLRISNVGALVKTAADPKLAVAMFKE